MPAEWAPHARCWMAWPCRAALWGGGLDAARAAYADVARTISRFEPVTMIARPEDAAGARVLCGSDITVETFPIDDSWMRDIGPTFLVDKQDGMAGCAWRFNAWGGKYSDYADDAALAGRLLDRLGVRRFDAPFVLEGGAIHCDGAGTVLTTESVLRNPNRNPGLDRAGMAALLRDWLGAATVIWLEAGLAEDETDGHVDNVACFAGPGRVLALRAPTPDDPNHGVLEANLAILQSETDAAGRRLQIETIDQPALFDAAGKPLAASYLNFYVANGGVVMPRFDLPEDGPAAEAVAAAFPGRAVVQVDALPIVRGGGGIHCITQQQPAVPCLGDSHGCEQ
jgi:agmatine deiminase